MECENLKNCPFYNDKMNIESGLGKLYKQKYCMENKTECARYMVLKELGVKFVPVDLYPNMHEKAKDLIAKNK